MINSQKSKKNLHLVIVQLKELKIEIKREEREQEVAMSLESRYFQEVQQEIEEVNLDEFWS